MNYDFIIFTHYIEQMNRLVERINWSAGSYWGEPGKMRFKTNIESYTDSTELADRDRVVKTEFSVSLKGYLIPDAFNELQGPHTMQKYLTPKKLVIGAETDLSVASIVSTPDEEPAADARYCKHCFVASVLPAPDSPDTTID